MSSRKCECCKTEKCKTIRRVAIGNPTHHMARVCGRCLVWNVQKLRQWIDAEEAKLK